METLSNTEVYLRVLESKYFYQTLIIFFSCNGSVCTAQLLCLMVIEPFKVKTSFSMSSSYSRSFWLSLYDFPRGVILLLYILFCNGLGGGVGRACHPPLRNFFPNKSAFFKGLMSKNYTLGTKNYTLDTKTIH